MNTCPSFLSVLCQCVRHSIGTGLCITALLVLLVLLLSNCARAETVVPGEAAAMRHVLQASEVESGALLFQAENGFRAAPLLHTDVRIRIAGMIARATVRQSFQNPSAYWQEGIYVFPLPETAAVDHMRMHIGERVIEGQIREKARAKKQYAAARRAGKKATLVEQERPNIFTTSVANIGPGERIVVEIEYQQITRYDQGGFSLRFPTVVAPRYIPGIRYIEGFAGSGWARNTDLVADAGRITPPVRRPGKGSINPFSIHIDLEAGFDVESIDSPYHGVEVKGPAGRGNYSVTLAGRSVPADRDFVLRWRPTSGAAPRAALFREKVRGAEYALIMVLPPDRPQAETLSREVIFVIDTSGSMAGTSIRQARSALRLALSRLQPGDRFNIIQFNSRTARLFPSPVPLSPASLRRARAYVARLRARGGTEMAAAIRAALANPSPVMGLRQVIFLTDGSVGNESALFRDIERLLGDSRLFTVGIGSAPNAHFMKRAARFGRGTHTYIGDTAEVEQGMRALFSKLENPVLGDLSLVLPGSVEVESWPQRIPDLYLGEPLLLSLKSRALPEKLTLRGRLAGASWSSSLAMDGGQQSRGVSVLWARKKIDALTDLAARGEEPKGIRQQILDTALEHHLVSRYTSLLAVDVTTARGPAASLHRQAMPVNLPAGWQYGKVFGVMPATATPAIGYLLGGGLVLLIGLFLRRVSRHG